MNPILERAANSLVQTEVSFCPCPFCTEEIPSEVPQEPKIKSLYVIGALKNKDIPQFANEIQALGIEAFADWFSPGEFADTNWKEYSLARGLTYAQALESRGAKMIFEFDKSNLDRCDAAVVLAPFGKSAALELGYTVGKGKPGFIVFDGEQDRWDVMIQFSTKTFFSKEEFFQYLKENK